MQNGELLITDGARNQGLGFFNVARLDTPTSHMKLYMLAEIGWSLGSQMDQLPGNTYSSQGLASF